jgi:phage terminase large subunit
LSDQKITIDRPILTAFEPLTKPARYKGAYGGRGGAKSHFFAEELVELCCNAPIRAVCIREVQNSIRDSVRQLLVDKIEKFGVGWFFEVLDNEIRGKNGSLVIFRGMQHYNAETIKSLEAYDVAWVEEAQTLSAKSLELLRPTIRKEGSELWFSWNPRHRTDPVDIFFRKNPHPESVAVMVSWKDNRWFPDVLRKEMEHDRRIDPEIAEHVWDGAYGMQQGAILARWVDRAERAGRINDSVAFDPEATSIEISSDLGFRDTATWWFWQRKLGGYSLLDYVGDSGLEAKDWIARLQDMLTDHGWPLGKIWLPHDAMTKTFQSKESAIEQFLKEFGPNACGIVPKTSKADRINAARTVIKQCEFHKTRCEEGLDGLRAWEFEYNPDTLAFSREPLHNWASHPSDGYSYGCQVMQLMPPPEKEVKKPKWWHEQTAAEIFALDKFEEPNKGWI